MRHQLIVSLSLACLATAIHHIPPKPEGIKVLESKLVEGATLSYKEVTFNPLAPQCTYNLSP